MVTIGIIDRTQLLPQPRQLTVSFQPQRRRTLSQPRSAWEAGTLPELIDTRSYPEFAGEIDAYLPRMGRLPGAKLAPFASLFDGDGQYVERERYMQEVAPLFQHSRETVAYCEVGVRACLFALLHEVYTGEVLPVSDGSLMEWSLEKGLPMETDLREASLTSATQLWCPPHGPPRESDGDLS